MIALILISQSITVFSIIALYYSGVLNYLARSKYIWLGIFALFFLLLFSLRDFIVILEDWQQNFVSMKLNSIFFRFGSILRGHSLIMQDWTSLYFGFGSGRSEELIGRVMHNSVAQTLFDHGIIGLLGVLMLLAYFFKHTEVKALFLSMVLFSLLFDPFWSYIFSILPIFGGYTYRNETTRAFRVYRN